MKHFHISIHNDADGKAKVIIGLDKFIVDTAHKQTDDPTMIVVFISRSIHTYCYKNEIRDFDVMTRQTWYPFTGLVNPNAVMIEGIEKHRKEYEDDILNRIENVFLDKSKELWRARLAADSKLELDYEVIMACLRITKDQYMELAQNSLYAKVHDREEGSPLFKMVTKICNQMEIISKMMQSKL